MAGRLVLVPGHAAQLAQAYQGGGQPRVDALELAHILAADLLSWSDVDASTSPFVRVLRLVAGRSAALAWLGWRHPGTGTIISQSETVGMVLAALRWLGRRDRRHVVVARRLTSRAKQVAFRLLRLQRGIDTIVSHSEHQLACAAGLGMHADHLHCLPYHCDEEFFIPPATEALRRDIVAAGSRSRDYATLLAAMDELEAEATIVSAPARSLRHEVLDGRPVPQNVVVCSELSPAELRDLYGQAAVVVVPLHAVDTVDGAASVYEALACGTPVVVTDTPGLSQALDGLEGVLRVPAGDPEALLDTLGEILDDGRLAASMGRRGRRTIEAERGLDAYLNRVTAVVALTETAPRAPEPPLLAGLWDVLADVWAGLTARFWLRRLQAVGERVRVWGRPRIENRGHVGIGAGTLVDSRIVPSELVAHDGGRIEIGGGVVLHHGASITSRASVTIGDHCEVGSFAIIVDSDAPRTPGGARWLGDNDVACEPRPVVLGRGVWLGARVTILKGVTIGDNAVIGAGSVVTRSIPANCVAAGVPARVLRTFDAPADGDPQDVTVGILADELADSEPDVTL